MSQALSLIGNELNTRNPQQLAERDIALKHLAVNFDRKLTKHLDNVLDRDIDKIVRQELYGHSDTSPVLSRQFWQDLAKTFTLSKRDVLDAYQRANGALPRPSFPANRLALKAPVTKSGNALAIAKTSHPREIINRNLSSNFGKMIKKKQVKKPKSSSKMIIAKAPASQSMIVKNSPYVYRGGSGLTVTHREYLGDVSSTGTTFNVEQFAVIQPGDPESFPWLSAIAGRFEKYSLKNLKVSYVPTCASTTAGSVMLAFDQNAARTVPQSKIQMLEYKSSAKAAAWCPCEFQAQCPSGQKYTLLGNNYSPNVYYSSNLTGSTLITASDIKTFAAGQLFVACDAVAAGTVGEVYIDYTIEFTAPGVYSLPNVAGHIYQATSNTTGSQIFNVYPTTPTYTTGTLFMFPGTTANQVIVPDMPAGQWMVWLSYGAQAADTGTMSFSVPTGYTVNTPALANGNPTENAHSGTVTIIAAAVQTVQPCTLTITLHNTNCTASCGASLRIFPYDVLTWG